MQPIHRRSLIAAVLFLLALSAPAHGRPPLASAGSTAPAAPPLPNNQYWDRQFIPPGVDGGVMAIAVNGNDVYVGGRFESAGGVAAHNLARWDGSRWHAVGQSAAPRPALNAIYDLLVISGTLHIATSWPNSLGIETPMIQTWDGQRWGDLTGQPPYRLMAGIVSDLQLYNGQLYAAGTFDLEGAALRDGGNIARWDGAAWRSVGGGLMSDPATRSTLPGWGSVETLTVYQGALIAGGSFSTAAGAPADLIARWDGNAWSKVGDVHPAPNQNERVNALAASGGALYAGGRFSSFGGAPAASVASWDGTAWQAMGQNDPVAPPQVQALALRGGQLYAGTIPAVDTQFGLTIWNGAAWRQEVGFAGRRVYAFGQNATTLYMGGWFTVSDIPGSSYPIGGMLRLTDSGWHGLGNGLPAKISDGLGPMVAGGDSIYMRGSSNVLVWNRAHWFEIAPPGGITGNYSLAASTESVYVTGRPLAGPGLQLWRWDGRTWAPIGGAFNGDITALAADGPHVYAAGSFTAVGGAASGGLAHWDGGRWRSISGGLGAGTTITRVNVLAAHGGMLVAGGDFSSIDGVAAADLARWNGQAWSAFPAVPTPVRSIDRIAMSGAAMYLIGLETAFLHWDGGAWQVNSASNPTSPGGTISAGSSVGALAAYAGQPVVASEAGLTNILRWNGTQWESLGRLGSSFSSSSVSNLVVQGKDLFASGTFTHVEIGSNWEPSHYFARWNPVRLSTYLPGVAGAAGR